ncbi:hypothetical protein CRG98_003960 [Punica granatum]|uniref:Uncharacterized protein n=1 Tax=Punica granatum TaxID=22663 RepID=A0A2I0L4Y8_PUNGR|nr:hypothetical protein CRG98_003960 [Punica granatum]
MEFPWSHQVGDSSSSKGKNHKHQNLHLLPKKRFSIKSGLTAWRPDNRQQLILDNLWSSMSNHQKGEESINALVLHMEEQRNGEASMQQELSQKIDSLQTELSLQKAQTQAFLQNRLEDEHRPEYQSLFGNNAWDIIRRSLHRSSSLFISIESSPPEWISSIRVQPAIHYIFISPVSSRSVLTPEAKFWPADGPIITQISKWRAWVQVNEWFWRKYPEHILQFSGNSQRVFQHLSLIDKPVQPGFSTRHNHWLDKFEEEYQLEAPTAYRRLYIP